MPSWEEQGGRQLAAPSWIVEGARRVAPYAQAAPSVEPGRAVLLSAVVPGAGQYALGQRRAWVYLALEAAGWIWWADRRSSAGRLVNEYRDFAWERARIAAGPRVDGDFDYYERLT